MGETASAMCHASARGLGKIAGFMANSGTLGQEKLLSEQTFKKMHSEPKIETIYGFGSRCTFYKGGVCLFTQDSFTHPLMQYGSDKDKTGDEEDVTPPTQAELMAVNGREGFVGWQGYGGSVL